MFTEQSTFKTFSSAKSEKVLTEDALLKARSRWLLGLFLSATLGLLALIFGLGLTVLQAVGVFLVADSINPTITILLVASLPLLFLTAHCMDKIRETELKVKLEYCKRLGAADANGQH